MMIIMTLFIFMRKSIKILKLLLCF
jgi:hypothetical protein